MKAKILLVMVLAVMAMGAEDCSNSGTPTSASGVRKATVTVPVGSDGLTTEQRNIGERLREDNKPGSIKHLYIISPYSGQVLLYSPVKGKVTSGGKRLNPTTVESAGESRDGFDIRIGNWSGSTTEVVQDDGTYGHSGEYLYWWDLRGVYHQHYLTGGQIVHVSSAPISVKNVIINVDKEKE